MILKEGGNIFKDAEGKPVTQRIARGDIDTTLDWVEKITGLNHKEMKLGSTGIRSSSGDIDVAVDQSQHSKEEVFQKLVAWQQKNHPNDNSRQWVAKSGTNVHLKTPINGNPANGFVQTDLMFGNPEWMKFALKGMGDGTPYKGSHRMIFLASIAKAQGMMWSPTKGLVDRETKEVITTDPNEIAKKLIGPGANRANLDSVETINKAIKGRPDYEQLTADVRANFENQGLPMPESKSIRSGMMLAERELDELGPSSVMRGIGNVGKGVAGALRTAKGGFMAGYKSKDGYAAAKKAYTDAGGGKTTIGQVKDLAKRTWDRATDDVVTVHGNVKGKYKKKKIARSDLDMYTKKGWKEVDPKKKKQIKDKDGNVYTLKDDSNTKEQPKNVVIVRQKKFGTERQTVPINVYNANRGEYDKAGFKMQGYDSSSTESIKKESINEGARIQHIEDLVFFEGSKGAMRALASLRNMASGGHKDVTIKWDGSPAVIFGRDEDGEFILTDKGGFVKKGGVGRAKSPDDLKAELLGRSGGKFKDDPGRIKFADSMAEIFSVFERAVPTDHIGFFKGDLLYYNTPKVIDKNFVFKPNPNGVEYAVDIASDLGKRIAKSKTAVVVHRMVDLDGSESGLKDLGMFQGNELLVVPPMSVETPPEVPNEEVERLANIIKQDSADIDSLLDKAKLQSMKLSDFDNILYNYVNQSVDRGTLDKLGRDFMSWLMNHEKISAPKKDKIAKYVKQNMKAFSSLWEVVSGIMKVKNNIIKQLDSQGGSVKATTAGQPGGEGYVLAHPGGDMKLVNRAGFTAANRAGQR
ncbi:MAG: hypothetical protein CL815_08220 [Coraliomargarita sp.]|nr:hypothetical protein [Coraliomargarita sp.]|tara:strand:- start:1708 stop:4125 length:2418 start_codon:yes stop_codon:yes gene_type:complete